MSDNNEQKKVQIKLERHLWPDEVEELRQKRRKKQNTVFLACCPSNFTNSKY